MGREKSEGKNQMVDTCRAKTREWEPRFRACGLDSIGEERSHLV